MYLIDILAIATKALAARDSATLESLQMTVRNSVSPAYDRGVVTNLLGEMVEAVELLTE
jgi:hypothetical protein